MARQMSEFFFVFFLTQTLTHFVSGGLLKKEVYEKVQFLENKETSDTPILSGSVRNIGACARLCFEEPLCAYHRLRDGTCSLYKSTPLTSTGQQGMTYFAKYGGSLDKCPLSMGYMSTYVPDLCFKMSEASDKRSWSDGQTQCQNDGGRLLLLNTEGRHDFIHQYLIEKSAGSLFVGMEKVGGVFKWIDGSDYVKQWGDVEPDYVSYQNCVALYSDGLSDIECAGPRRYICEIVLPG